MVMMFRPKRGWVMGCHLVVNSSAVCVCVFFALCVCVCVLCYSHTCLDRMGGGDGGGDFTMPENS